MSLATKPVSEVKLSPKAETLLEEWLTDVQEDDDTRGFYAEFESFDCKPWQPRDLAELLDHGFATADEASDPVPTLAELDQAEKYGEDTEQFGGVAFLKMTERGREYLVANGLTMFLEDN